MRNFTLLIVLLMAGLLSTNSLFAQKLNHVQGDVLVHLNPLENGETVKSWVARQTDRVGNPLNLELAEVISEYVGAYRLTFDYNRENERVILAELKQKPEVINAQFNHFVSNRQTIPNDPEFLAQWQYINTGQGGGTVGADIDMDLAWDFATGGLTANGDTIVACVIDGGIDNGHDDIKPNLWFNHAEIPDNDIDDDNNGYVDDYRGWSTNSNSDNVYNGGSHGTPVAGIVGAAGNNGIGVAGVNWNVKLMIVQGGTGVESEVLQAYSFPLEHRRRYNETNGAEGSFVVTTNASWGVDEGDPADSPLWCSFYDSLGVQGILNCGATANREFDIDVTGDLPTACSSDYLISVTNMNRNDEKVNGAGYGLTTIDLGAFGEGTWTTQLGGAYGSFGGTSGATPHVTGAVALLYSLDCGGLMDIVASDPGAAALLIKEVILEGVDQNESLQDRTVTGGRLNVFNSMEILTGFCGGCVAPFRGEVIADNDTLAIINFVPIDTASTLDLRYKAVESDVWDTLTMVTSPLAIGGLVGCQEYEYQFKATCDTVASDFGRSNFFITEGCCENPEFFEVSNVTDSTAVLGYESVYAAEQYNVQYREVDTEDWTTVSSDATVVAFAGLNACAEYEYRFQLVCAEDTLAYTEPANFFTLGCGPCTDLDYCASPELSVVDEWIGSIVIGDLENTSGAAENGYADFTRGGPTAEFSAYQDYEVSLTPDFEFFTFNEGWAIYIDFNQDGDFDDEDETVFRTSSVTDNTVTTTINIPADAPLGYTRMRVFMEYNRPVDGACRDAEQSSGFGEVEDYCVTIVEAPACVAPTAVVQDTTEAYSDSTAYVSWEAIDGVDEYTLRYRHQDSTDFITVSVSEATNYIFTNLENCGVYEVEIQSNCYTDYESDFTGAGTFMTACVSSVRIELSALEDWTVAPNPTSGFVRINYELSERLNDLSIRAYDQLGRQLFNRPVDAGLRGAAELNLGDLNPGVYYLRLSSASGVSAAKRVVVF